MARDYRCEFRRLYDNVDRLQISLSGLVARIEKEELTDPSIRQHLVTHTSDLVRVLHDHVEAFIESFGYPARGTATGPRQKLN